MITLTKPQRHALHRVYLRKIHNDNLANVHRHGGHTLPVYPTTNSYRVFRKLVRAYIGGDCVMIPFAGMWLGIEPDGYTHS